MYKKYILIILLIIAIFILHQSLILNLNWRFNFWPVILVFILFIFNERLALAWSVGAGFLLDVYSILPFGTYMVSLFLITFLTYVLAKNFITNRSFLSFLILTFIATLFYNGLLFSWQKVLIWIGSASQFLVINLSTIFVQLLSNFVLVIILYFITLKYTKRLKSDVF